MVFGPAAVGDKPATYEIAELARAAGCAVCGLVRVRQRSIDARFYLTGDKLREIGQQLVAEQATMLIVDQKISASQQRNIEAELCCRVLDRVELILDIFAQRARTYEGKLQVELAQLKHLSTRLIRGWSHLERQRGGIGLRGPGETQLETDRRLIGKRLALLQDKLGKVATQRSLGRSVRQASGASTVALVGYTNSGKSTLFNHLSGADVFAADLPFATLDPTLRKWPIRGAPELVLADTVGFIRDLPPQLVAAFRGTLEEVCTADLILKVVDLADDEYQCSQAEVRQVLEQLGADRIPAITIFNKIDLKGWPARVESGDGCQQVWLSAQTGQGLPLLENLVREFFARHRTPARFHFQGCNPPVRAWLYANQALVSEEFLTDGSWSIECSMSPRLAGQLKHMLDASELAVVAPPAGRIECA